MGPEMKKCTWILDYEDLHWRTGCGMVSVEPEDTPTEKYWNYCPFCGMEIVES